MWLKRVLVVFLVELALALSTGNPSPDPITLSSSQKRGVDSVRDSASGEVQLLGATHEIWSISFQALPRTPKQFPQDDFYSLIHDAEPSIDALIEQHGPDTLMSSRLYVRGHGIRVDLFPSPLNPEKFTYAVLFHALELLRTQFWHAQFKETNFKVKNSTTPIGSYEVARGAVREYYIDPSELPTS